MYGLILAESLADTGMLSDPRITITRQETWDVGDRAVDWQPKTWTVVYIEGAEKDLTAVAELVAQSIKESWYANLSDDTTKYVVFKSKVFSYLKGDAATKLEAQQYDIAHGIPVHQVGW